MTKFTPVFAKDGDTYIVPSADFIQDTAEMADVAGVAAELVREYGLSYTGRTEELSDEGKYPGPYVTATIRDKQVQIISGQSLVYAVEAGVAENVAPVLIGIDLASADKSVVAQIVAQVDKAVTDLAGGDHTGPDAI